MTEGPLENPRSRKWTLKLRMSQILILNEVGRNHPTNRAKQKGSGGDSLIGGALWRRVAKFAPCSRRQAAAGAARAQSVFQRTRRRRVAVPKRTAAIWPRVRLALLGSVICKAFGSSDVNAVQKVSASVAPEKEKVPLSVVWSAQVQRNPKWSFTVICRDV